MFAAINTLTFGSKHAMMVTVLQTKTGGVMAENRGGGKAVGKVRYESNPLITVREIVLKERTVKVGSARELVDLSTGEVTNVNAIYQRKIVDSEKFAKIYLDGLAKTFGLSKTALRVFQSILQICDEDTDSIWLNFMVAVKIDPELPERTFYRGLSELIKHEFVAHSDVPNKFWINPHLFFNGDRVKFITEYVKSDTMALKDQR